MALVNIENGLREALRHLETCKPGQGVEVMSYKRNRTVSLIAAKKDHVQIIENGYKKNELLMHQDKTPKYLRKVFKREFPRSRKVRLFKFIDPSELDRHHQKI